MTTQLAELVSISTTPKNGDEFGQLSGGELVLNAKLFKVPNFKTLANLDSSSFKGATFKLDYPADGLQDSATFFIPVVESKGYVREFVVDEQYKSQLDICGLLLQAADRQLSVKKAFKRVGFAVISRISGSIGCSDYSVENWKAPWAYEELEHVLIV